MKLMILDGNSIINRAFYGIRPLTTKDGLYTNAIFGFLNIFHKNLIFGLPKAYGMYRKKYTSLLDDACLFNI